jgi:tRNA wybutosine-synthesizing protein 2
LNHLFFSLSPLIQIIAYFIDTITEDQEMNEDSRTARVVLVAPTQHVKTIKSSLERCGQLDRSNKIFPEHGDGNAPNGDTSATDPGQDQDAQRAEGQAVPRSSNRPLSPDTAGAHQNPAQFPALKFDALSGEYVGSSALKFDVLSGEYVNPSVLQERNAGREQHISTVAGTSIEQSHTKPAFPKLNFDAVSGEYVEPSTLKTNDRTSAVGDQQRMRIPTTIPYTLQSSNTSDTSNDGEVHEFKTLVLNDLELSHLFQEISISYHFTSTTSSTPETQSPLRKALKEALNLLPQSALASSDVTPEALVSVFPDGYCVYKPMLLLPHNAFSSEPWKKLLSTHPANSKLLKPVWLDVAKSVDATHVAINSPIPLRTSTTSDNDTMGDRSHENILRSPADLTPIYGDFGPVPTPQTISSPAEADFKNALWVSTRQNGIWQTWAPLYTMFSRGNIREKTRILNLPSVAIGFDAPSTAADLYAGIGYFAFSYKKSGEGKGHGIKRVVCWELNPWSVEGLRRGAKMNGWTCQIVKEDMLHHDHTIRHVEPSTFEEDFIVFQMSNERAEITYASMGEEGLPVRHVNLGLLPTSRLSWGSAVRMLDFQRRGWVHVHENVATKDIESRAEEICHEFQGLVDEGREEKTSGDGVRKSVQVEHVERVKMYAPGVVHCVFDVMIGSC